MFSICVLLMLTSPGSTAALVQQISISGRVLEIATPFSERIAPRPQIAPGTAPLLAFRLFEGQAKRRFSNLDLVLDDAGH